MFLGTFGLQANLVRTGCHPPTHPPGRAPPTHPPTHPGATNVFGHIPASAQFGPNSRNAKNESFWAHSGFGQIWSQQPECRKRMFLGTFGLQPNLVRTAGTPKTNLFGHDRASAQFGPNSRNAEKECFWALSGFRPIWSEPGATHPPNHPHARHPPTHPPTRAPGMFLGNLVRTAGMPKTNLFGHIRASAQFGPNREQPTHPPTHPPGRHLPGRHPPTHPPTWAPQMFLGTFHLQANLVRTGRHAPTHPPTHPGATNVFGHIPASAQFGPNSRNAKNESFWAHSGFSPLWSEQPECQKRIFWGTFGIQPNLVRTAGMPKRNVFGHVRASGQFGPNRAPATHPPTHPGATHPPTHPPGRHPPTHQPTGAPQMFLGTFRLQPKLVRTAGMPKTNLFGHIQASAQFGPNSRYAENECFWAHSGFSPIWSAQPECQKRIFLGTFGLQPNLVRTAGMPKRNVFGHIRASGQFGLNRAPPTHPPTHPGATHPPTNPPGRHECFWAHSGFSPIWSEQPECQKRIFLGTFRLRPIFGPNSRNAENECFWAHSGFSPIWSAQPECQKRIFLGTFGLQPNLVRTAGMPKTNLFGHIRASAQFGPNSRNAEKECFWAHSGFMPIWSEPGATHPPTHPPGRHPPTHQPTRAPRMFLGTFRLQPNLVRTAGMPKTNLFGHIQASAKFGPNSRNAENECFWAHSGFSPIWSAQPERQKRIFLGTIGLQPNLVRTAGMPKRNVFGHFRASGQFGPNRAPPTHPTTHPRATHPPTHPLGRQECFWGNLVRTAGMPKTNLFGHIRASAQFGPNREQPTHPPTHPPGRHLPGRHPPTHPPTWAPQMFLGTFHLQANLVQTGRHAPTHPPTHPGATNVFGHIPASAQFGPNREQPTHPATHPPGRHPPGRHPPTHPPTHPGATNVFGHIPASAQFGPNSRNAKNESFWAHLGFSPLWSEQPECQKRI